MMKRIARVGESNEAERCAKHEAALANRKIQEKSDQVSDSAGIPEEDEDEEEKEELPFQDILAEQRREYTKKQDFVYSIYTDLIKNIVKEREGKYLRKTSNQKNSPDKLPTEDDAKEETILEGVAAIEEQKMSVPDPRLHIPDEDVKIIFVNDNSYTGRISRQKMEGQGLYRWRNGVQYKGEFEDNKIQGKGTLEWQDCCWYEGDFSDGYRHGKGTMVDRNYNLLYVGHWRNGCRHGKGYCRYEKGDSYDGDWIMGKCEGLGNRIYPSGARYVGHWKDGLRHGIGIMAWPNGDVYRGEWKHGKMHGYGEYTWNGFFNKTLCWPQEISYLGGWHEGTRHGKGQLSLNTMGGARYSGEWENNQKHGYGTIIGNNGDITEGDPLFENNFLLPTSRMNKLAETKDSAKINNGSKNTDEFPGKPTKIPEARVTAVLKPEQCLPLWYYIDRLRKTQTASPSSSETSLISGKCRECEDKSSCCCLRRFQDQAPLDGASRSLPKASSFNSPSTTSATTPVDPDKKNGISPEMKKELGISSESSNLEQEEIWTHDCITRHMPRIRKVYDVYSKIFCKDPPKCRLSMSKLSLWQLWRDCGIHRKGLSLVQIDNFLASNRSTLMDDPHCPFGRIEIWQLLHALLEVSWHIYTKNEDSDADGSPGRLANGLEKFLVQDIYPNYGKSAGILVGPERDLLPLYPVYQLYISIGKFHSARQLLKAIFTKQGNENILSQPFPEVCPEGKNAVTVGEKISYLSSGGKPLILPKPDIEVRENQNPSGRPMLTFRELGIENFTHIMSVVCPAITDSETGLIINIEYQITFLEFLEIFVEAGKKLVLKRELHRRAEQAKIEAAETASIVNSAKERRSSRSNARLSSASKSTKSKKKLVTKH